MLEQIADELYAVLQEKDLTCEVEAEDNLNIYGDPDKLARVFDNILRNAIAYCYAGTKIRIEAHKKKNDIEIIFSNHGGTDSRAQKLQTIFEKFYRLDDSRSSETGGQLGCHAKEIVELHGGRIMAKSDDEQTQFIVLLPSRNKQEEKEEIEIHSHRRRTFRSSSRGRKGLQRKAGHRNLGDISKDNHDM